MKTSTFAKRQARLFLGLRIAIAVGIVIAAVPALAQTPTTVYTVRNLNLRAGPGLGYAVLVELPAGEALTVLGQSSVWFNVRRANGVEGWVSGSYVSANPPGSGGGGAGAGTFYPVPPQTGDVAQVTASILNVRTGPGVNLPVIVKIYKGDFVVVLAKDGAWRQVRTGNGTIGWVNGQWLSGAITVLPQLPPSTGGGSVAITTVVTPANPTPIEVLIVTTGRLNVRTGPGGLYAVVTTVGSDEFVTVLGKVYGWRYIQTASGQRGWASTAGLGSCDCALP